MQSFISLLLTIISVSFIVFISLDTSIHCLRLLNTAQSQELRACASGESANGESASGESASGLRVGESRASEEQATQAGSVSGVQASEEQKIKERIPPSPSRLQKLMLKFRRRQT